MSTLSGLLSAELAATCNALGFYDGEKYHLEPHCKETIKDLIRYLRRDEATHDIRRYLGNAKLLQTDLLPIMQCHYKDNDLFDVLLRLIVNLTNPALLLYHEVIPTDKNEHNLYLEIVNHLRNYKEAFCNQKIWTPITERLGNLLNKEPENRDEDDDRTIERILILVRNVLHVPANADSEWRPDNDASVHDQVLWAFHQSGLLDLLLYMTSSPNESNFCLHLLEIICLMVREQPPTLLAKTASERSVEEKNRDDEQLLRVRQSETLAKQQKLKKFLGTRPNFSGTYVIKNMKSTSDRELIFHKPLRDENDILLLDKDKKKTKVPKNRRSLTSETCERRSALSIRLILKQFCVEILNASYNPLMKLVKELLVRGKSQDNDESYYFTALKFFMEFNRNYKFQVKLVSETMSVETFHFVQKYIENWFEMMLTDKKRIPLWSSRTHIALNAYKELLYNLAQMDRNEDAGVRECSKVIKSNIFYVIEYREMLLTLTNTFDQTKYSRQYLKDLIETIHIFLKLLSAFTKNKKLVVQKQVKKRKQKKPKKKENTEVEISLEEKWKDLSERLSAVLVSPINAVVIPFDAASEVPMEEQKVEAVQRINTFLKTDKLEEAVALLRSSREVWPENDTFGSSAITPEEELNWFKEVYLADLQTNSTENTTEKYDEDEEIDEEEEEEIENYQAYAEQNFDVMDLIKRFASAKMIGICILLLKTFDTNKELINHCVAKMLHRIAWDCKLPAMLFQATLFCIFQKILMSDDPKFKELADLAKYTVRKFSEVAQTNKKVFVELLFFKTPKDAFEIESGYGSYIEERQKSKLKASKVLWEEHEEEELKRLYEEYMQNKPSEDLVEWIMDNLINKERSKRGVIKKMKELNLTIEKPRKHKKFTAEQESELCSLFNEFKETNDPVKAIMEKLSFPMSRSQIRNTLFRLKMVQDKNELKRKRKEPKRKKNKSKFDEEEASDEERSDSSDSDDDLSSSRIEEEPLLNLPLAIIHLVEAMHTHSYLSEGLKWIKASFQECLDDLDDEPSEVPLLPLSADSILSIDNKQFQQFLKAIKICSPQQQEVYWRIPASWKDIDFVNRISLLEILLSHDEDELSSYSDELNLPIKKITGESCDIDKLLEESNHRNLLNNSEVNVDPSLPSTSSNNFASENFDDIIADHCRRALDNELLDNKNENITSNFSKKSKNKFKNDSSDSENELSDNVNRSLNVNDKTEDAFDKLLGKHNSKSNLNENRKKKTSKRIIQDNSSDEENEGSESVKKSLKINDNTEDAFDKLLGKQNSKSNLNENRKKKTSKRIIQDNSSDEENEGSENVEKSLKINNNTEDAFDKLLGKQSSKSNLNENRKKKTSKRIIQDNSSDEENVIVKTNDTPKLKIDSDDDETEKLPKKSIRKLESDSDEEESNIPSAELIKNVQKLTNGEETITENIRTDSKRLRSSDEEDNEDVLPKNKSKKRVVIESDED